MKKLLTIITLAISTITMMADSYRGTKFYHEDLEYEIISDSTGYAVEVIGKKTSSQSVVIPASVTYQGVNLPVKNIGQYASLPLHYAIYSPRKEFKVPLNAAFQYQSSLTSVTLPNSIIHIGRWAFYRCTSLPSINIPNSVTSIGDHAFDACKSLISITIPNSVTWIGGEAFCDCSSLTSVTIPDGVTHINSGTFKNCSSLTSITIPNSVTHIENHAFKGCSSLTSITIPSSVTSIGGDAFYGTALYNDPANWENGALYIDNCLIKVDNAYDGNFTIRANTRLIADWAFSDCSHLNIDPLFPYPSMNTNRKSLACTSVTSVTIPNSVKIIGDGAFRDCSSLTSVTIPNSVTSIGWNAFKGCSSLTSVTIPNSVTSIGWNAFYGCSSLKSVTIPDGVTHIGERAFAGCDSLTSVRIPTSVIEIGEGAFPEHTKITRVEILSFKYQHNGHYHSFTSSLPSTDSVFADAKIFSIGQLTYKTTSSTTAEVYDADEDITRVSIPTTVTNDHTTYHVTRIGKEAFKYCAQLTSVTIPNSVTEIGNLAFGGCYSLTSITIPNSVKKIGSYAFIKCSALTNATIPNSLKSIENNAFSYCSSLTSITLPNSVTSIEQRAFYECSALTSVTIPNSVTSIGHSAFWRTALYNNPANWENGVLYINDCLIAIDSTFTQVRSRSIFDDFFNDGKKYAIKENTRLIADWAFEGCTSLTSVTIPYGVTHIGGSAFQDCKSLTSVTIPNSVKHIGDRAFYRCSALTSITIPNSVTEIGSSAFCGCTSLRYITIPKRLEPRGWDVFCDSFNFATIHYSETESNNNNNSSSKGKTEEEPLIIRNVQLQEDGETYSVPAVEGQLVIMFDEDMSHEESTNMLKEKGLSIISSIPELNYYLLQVPVGEEGQYFSQLNDNDLVDYVYPNAIEYFCSASAYALDNYNKTSDHGRRVSKMLTGCDPMMDKAGCDPLMNLEEKNVASSDDRYSSNSKKTEALSSILFSHFSPSTLPASSNSKVVINISIGTALKNKSGEDYRVLWNDDDVTESNRKSYVKRYISRLKELINLVKKFDKVDFVIVNSTGNEGMKQLETIIDELIYELNLEDRKVFERHFILVSAKDDYGLVDYPTDVSRYHKMVSKVDISDMTRQDTAWRGTSFASPRLAGYIYKLAEKYDLPATTVLRFVRSATEKAIDNVVTYELIEQEIENYIHRENSFVDLGLPSGTLWKAESELGLYTYQEANDMFVSEEEHLPTYEQLFELKQECMWWKTETGYMLTGPNGNSITFLSDGYDFDMIWSSTTDADRVYSMGIDIANAGIIQSDNYNGRRSVHLVQSAEKEEENVADNIITYTSSDGNIINPSANSFGATIVSNTYKNGRGTIIFDGPITSIGEYAFKGCSSLTSITIPNSVTWIGSEAFSSCYSLTSLTIPNSVTRIVDWAFADCFSLTSVKIPNSVTSIGDQVFSGCYSLTSVTIPNSVTSIGKRAFSYCSSLTSVTIPYSVAWIGDWAFDGCESLTSVTIPNSVAWIGDWAFYGCSSLTYINIPNSVTAIGSGAFEDCSALTSITVDAGNTHFDSRNNCNAIIETATNTLIAGCKTTTIPNSVTGIGSRAFQGCSSLTSITIPNSVTWIGWDAFHGCSSLTSINIPNSVKEIKEEAFRDCSSLTSITIPNSVKSIGDKTFSGCSALTSVTIPNSVTSIGDWAFWDCESLTSVTIPNSVTEVSWNVFPDYTKIIRK